MTNEIKKKKYKLKTKKRPPLKTVEEIIKLSILIVTIILAVIGFIYLIYKLYKLFGKSTL